jgi:hypothetical protein
METCLSKWLPLWVIVGQQPSSIIVPPCEDINTFPGDKRPLVSACPMQVSSTPF